MKRNPVTQVLTWGELQCNYPEVREREGRFKFYELITLLQKIQLDHPNFRDFEIKFEDDCEYHCYECGGNGPFGMHVIMYRWETDEEVKEREAANAKRRKAAREAAKKKKAEKEAKERAELKRLKEKYPDADE